MTKHELIWVTIRVFGLLLLGYAFSCFLEFAKLLGVNTGSVLNDQVDVGGAMVLSIIFGAAEIAFLVIVGVYLVKDGSAVFSILNKENDETDSQYMKISD